MKITRDRIEKLLVDAGHAINANNGRCLAIELVLCRVTSLCTDLLQMPWPEKPPDETPMTMEEIMNDPRR